MEYYYSIKDEETGMSGNHKNDLFIHWKNEGLYNLTGKKSTEIFISEISTEIYTSSTGFGR